MAAVAVGLCRASAAAWWVLSACHFWSLALAGVVMQRGGPGHRCAAAVRWLTGTAAAMGGLLWLTLMWVHPRAPRAHPATQLWLCAGPTARAPHPTLHTLHLQAVAVEHTFLPVECGDPMACVGTRTQ